MKAKPRFNPVVTRIKLNPEQAVLACSCYSNRRVCNNMGQGGKNARSNVCFRNSRRTNYCSQGSSSSVS